MHSRRFRRRWDIRNQKSAKIESVAYRRILWLAQRTLKMLLPSSIVPLSIGMGRVTACALRGCRALSLRSPFSPSQPFPPQGGLGGFQLRASTSTAYLKIRWVWRARWASKGSCLAYPFTFCGAEQRQGHAVTPSLKQGLPPPMPYYFVNSLTRCPSSGRMSFSIARRTAFSEPGVENSTRPLMMPAVALLMMAGEPIS